MKKNLGRLIALFILTLFTSALTASDYKWSVEVNKKEAHVNEAIHLKYTCSYSDDAELYVIEFNPSVEKEEYKIAILREDEKILNGKKINEYEFVLFVKKEGVFSLALDTLMKETNKDSIENGMLGRDNANYEEFTLHPYKQKKIELNILKTASSKVGEFTLNVRKDEPSIEAYAPFHLEFSVSGVGDFQVFKDVDIKIEGVEVFSEVAKEEIELTADGYRGTWKKKFAFVSDKRFTIPAWETHYFDLELKKMRTLKFDALEVDVRAAKFKKEELLDPKEEEFSFDISYLYYVLTFIAGFIAAKIKLKRTKQKNEEEELFCKRIKNADTLEKLNFVLVTHDMKIYEEIIAKIEAKELTSLSKAKSLICV